jgi:uncharacterized membrane protein YphA (DoxX/SURF4 family)
MNSFILFILSFLILLLFILSGFSKIKNINGTAKYLKKNVNINIPFNLYIFAIILVIFLQIIGSLTILYSSLYINKIKNLKYAYYSCISLAVFTILATLIFHMPPTGKNYYDVLKNISITGALLLLADKFNYNPDFNHL